MITKMGNEYLVILIDLNAKKLTPVIFVNLLSRFPLMYGSKGVLLEGGGRTVGVVVLPDFFNVLRIGALWIDLVVDDSFTKACF